MAIILYSSALCPYSHRCRFAFCEKEMEAEIKDININDKPEELIYHNQYNEVPLLLDRDIQIFESSIINEYINDRFPHPQLMPTDIMAKAKVRLVIKVLDRDIFPHLRTLTLKRYSKKEQAENARRKISEGLIKMDTLFPRTGKYLIDKEITLLDIAMAPLLWRLDYFGIQLPPAVATPLQKYADRVFARPGFAKSLSSVERVMR